MKMIAAADKNWAIGNKGELLTQLSGDMKFFRSKTAGNVVILGRKTLSTFPGGKPLKNRENIVLTTNEEFDGQGAVIVHSVEELLEYAKRFDDGDVYVIGGESVYSQLIQYCDTAYITKFDKEFEADVYIENLDKSEEWFLDEESEPIEEKGICYHFCTYRRK
ncbi:Dihydrofolate reductase [bioreactor metagenome]|uniref:dihydrofolate reductase n=1 Tax=bioreactor metagenome TaxID=1076179 RepID=A0A644Z103_9ZZZZ|nr:dihydrofolate reductase [Candidatus Metalachnospira sp.]